MHMLAPITSPRLPRTSLRDGGGWSSIARLLIPIMIVGSVVALLERASPAGDFTARIATTSNHAQETGQ